MLDPGKHVKGCWVRGTNREPPLKGEVPLSARGAALPDDSPKMEKGGG